MISQQEEYRLSFLDQQPHIRNYARHLTIFPFPDERYTDAAIDALCNGLSTTLQQLPFLAGHLNLSDSKTESLKLEYTSPMDVVAEAKRIFNASLVVATHPDYSYDILSQSHFDSSQFPAEVVCPAFLRHHSGLDDGDSYATGRTSFAKGITLPVLATQVAFIPGGLVLSVWIHHCVADGAGVRRIYEVWSENVGKYVHYLQHTTAQQENQQLLDDQKPQVSIKRPSIGLALDNLAQNSNEESDATESAHEVVALRESPYEIGSTMFRISSSTVDELATTFTTLTGCRVSPFMALAALLWAHVNRARSPLLAPSAIASSTMVTVVDLRTRLGPPFTDLGYIGNCVLSAKPTCQVSKDSPAHPLTADVIAPLAAKVSHSIRSFTRPVIESRLATIVSSTTSPPMTDCEGLTFANGLDIYITDWRRIGINNEWDIPGTSSSKPAVVRRACWKGEGGIVVLPRRAEGDEDWEVMISLEDGELKAFAEEIRGGGWLVGEMEKEVEGLGRAKL